MQTIEIRYKSFECQKVKRRVILNSIVVSGGNGDTMDTANEQDFAFDCDQKKQCGVATEFGRELTIDWSECDCSELKSG